MNIEPIKRRVIFCIAIIVLIFMASLVSLIVFYQSASPGTYAYLYQDGVLIETITLSDITQNYSLKIEGTNGAYNTIEVHDGEIGIVSSSCPDGLCMNMGFIHDDLLPITCLPNKLVIKVVSEESDTANQALDGITY